MAFGVALFSPAVVAELSLSGGVEYLHWVEDTNPSVTEKGPLIAGGIISLRLSPRAWFHYRGNCISAKSIRGAGYSPAPAISSTTYYTGLVNEVQRAGAIR